MKFKNILSVATFTLISRVLGLIRDILLAKYLGAGFLSDGFVVAFKIPNLFRKLFAEGSMQSGFIPIFAKELGLNKEEAKKFAETIYTIMFVLILLIVIILEIFTPALLNIISPGFKSRGTDIYEITVLLIRITLPYLFFISLSSLYASILNSLGKFIISAFLPAFLNIAIILMLCFRSFFSNVAIAACVGVTLGGLLQFGVILYACIRLGWYLNFHFFRRVNNSVLLFFKKIIPTVLGAGVYQLNILIDIVAASFLPFGAMSYLYYADRIYQFPLALIGIAIATVVLPFVSNINKNSQTEIQIAKDKSILFALAFSLPATIGILIFHHPIIEVIFSRGEFTYQAVESTSSVLMIYSYSLPFNILIKVILPFFYSKGDTKTPFISTLVCLGLNLCFVFVLSFYYSYNGIAMATVLASLLNFLFLVFFLFNRLQFKVTKFLLIETVKIILVNIVFILILFGINFIIFTDPIFILYNNSVKLVLTIFISIVIFILLSKIFKSFIYEDILKSIKFKKRQS